MSTVRGAGGEPGAWPRPGCRPTRLAAWQVSGKRILEHRQWHPPDIHLDPAPLPAILWAGDGSVRWGKYPIRCEFDCAVGASVFH